MTTNQKWRKLLDWLKRNFPAEDCIHIRSVSLSAGSARCHGWIQAEIGYFQINVSRNQCFALRVETLIHEWAHALTWFGAETHQEDHSAEWGIQYAKIYRTFCEWNWGKKEKE